MFFLMEIVLLIIGILLLMFAIYKRKVIRRTAIFLAIPGILLIGAGLSMFFLVLSGRMILPLG